MKRIYNNHKNRIGTALCNFVKHFEKYYAFCSNYNYTNAAGKNIKIVVNKWVTSSTIGFSNYILFIEDFKIHLTIIPYYSSPSLKDVEIEIINSKSKGVRMFEKPTLSSLVYLMRLLDIKK